MNERAGDGLEGESPREALGNVIMAMREQARLLLRAELWLDAGRDLEAWASRLERAVRALEAEKTGAAYLSEQLHAADRREESLVAEVAGLRADGQRLRNQLDKQCRAHAEVCPSHENCATLQESRTLLAALASPRNE